MQVGFVDRLVGELLFRLKTLDLYDRSLIVITADHGVNFWPKKSRRGLLKSHPMDVLGVPLFIKIPNQHEGEVSEQYVESIDILPTIANVIGISIPWAVDGHSIIEQINSTRSEKTINHNRLNTRYPFVSEFNPRKDSVKRKIAIFGSGKKPDGLFEIGHYNELVGQQGSGIDVIEESEVLSEIDRPEIYEHLDPDASFVPCRISGFVKGDNLRGSPLNLAVGVNGTIRAVTRSFHFDKGVHKFSAVVPESSFKKGRNEIQVFVISELEGKIYLKPTIRQAARKYSYISPRSDTSEMLICSDGESVPVMRNALKGHLGIADIQSNQLFFAGWAADVENADLPKAVVIFVDGKFFHSGHCNVSRPDVAKHFNDPALEGSGFRYTFPLSLFKDIDNSEIRFFAVSKKNVASELQYPKGYKWRKKS